MTREEAQFVRRLYKAGLINATTVMRVDIYEKFNSLPGKASDRVRAIANDMGMSKDSVYRAVRIVKMLEIV